MNISQSKLVGQSFKRGDSSIRIRLSGNCLDLKKLTNENELYEWLHNPKCQRIKIGLDNTNYELKQKLKNAHEWTDELQMECEMSGYNLPIYFIETLKENYLDNKEKILNIVEEKELKNIAKIRKIMANNDTKMNDEGLWYLYVGAYYLYGIINSQKEIKAPLLIYQAKIVYDKTNSEYWLEKVEDKIFSNNKLSFLLLKENNFILSELSSNEYSDFYNLLTPLKSKIDISKKYFEMPIVAINENHIQVNDYCWSIEPFCTLSLMDPLGGAILKDVKEIQEKGEELFEFGDILEQANEKYQNAIVENDDLIYINNHPNIYQKYAIKAALNENIVIHGPPGTGKSETIANIIANIINLNKNVLMCSEKKPALDVLMERLGDLSKMCLNIYGLSDKKSFYEKIKELIEQILSPNSNSINDTIEPLINNKVQINKIKNYYNTDNTFLDFSKTLNFSYNDYLEQNLNELLSRPKNVFINNEYLSSNQNESFNSLTNDKEKINKYLQFIKYNDDSFNEYLSFKSEIEKPVIQKFLQFYHQQKDKNKEYVINYFLNTGKLKKPNIFSKKIPQKFNLCTKKDKMIDFLESTLNIEFPKNYKNIDEIKCLYSTLDTINFQDVQKFYDIKNISKFLETNNIPLNFDHEVKKYYTHAEENTKHNIHILLSLHTKRCFNYLFDIQKNPEYKKAFEYILKKTKSKRFPSISEFLKTNHVYEIMRILFPIWVMTPNEISKCLPNEKNIFDYGIFDEASQMFLENSLPSVYRCEKLCIAGDDKQLKPSSFFMQSFNADEDDLDNDETDEFHDDYAAGITSLLDKAHNCYWKIFTLKNHYRSTNAELMDFSNKYIYNNELETATKNGCFSNAISVMNVNGTWNGKCNRKELQEIKDYLIENYTEASIERKEKWLIITSNVKQKDELEDLLFRNINNESERQIKEGFDSNLIKIRNIENVQGDEADIVIFSLTYGPNEETGKVLQNFGPLINDGGSNRLNVAITRAKKKMIVLKSLYGKDINPRENKNTQILKNFIEFLDSLEDNQTLYSKVNCDLFDEKSNEFDSGFEISVYNKLKERLNTRCYQIITQFPVGSKRIDMVIVDKIKNVVSLAIEVDGLKYHSGYKKIMEDLDRQEFLEARGYPIYRIKELEWKRNNKVIIDEIIQIINKFSY